MTAGSTTAPDRSTTAPVDTPAAWIRRFAWIALRLATILVVIWMVHAGIRFRDQLWTNGDAIHFRGDIQNTLHQGEAVIAEGRSIAQVPDNQPLSWIQFLNGYLHRYDTVYAQGRDDRFDLDYTPARLLIAAIWVRELHADHPNRSDLIDRDLRPLLNLNTGCELASVVAMFLLVRHWWRRKHPQAASISQKLRRPSGPAIIEQSDTAWFLGLVAATALWWNAALLLDSHEWPQWDVWLLPFFLAALWLASCEWWFVADR